MSLDKQQLKLIEREMALPTVILNLPELSSMLSQRRRLKILFVVISTFALLCLGVLIYIELFFQNGATVDDDSVILTVKLEPPDIPNVRVMADGKPLGGDPLYIILPKGDQYHSVLVEAPGYETYTRDIRLASSEIIEVSMHKAKTRADIPTDIHDTTKVLSTDW